MPSQFLLIKSFILDACEENSDADYCFMDSDEDGFPDILIFCNFSNIFFEDNCPTMYI